ncbi:P-loop containing nucleoside triphosphate hydrolase protein [Bisporella sp. PMI_857]|nr:P-loop containing nucleoside triphosphate hydrolase protein [Bisporella sp. PMI_857]
MLSPPENSQAFVEMYKIAVIGGPRSGKTSLLMRFLYDVFTDEAEHPGEQKSYSKEIEIDGSPCILQFLETTISKVEDSGSFAGIEECDAVIIVYSICEDPWRASIQERIRMRYNLVKEIKKRQGLDSTEFPILILGTKKDHVAERVIDIEKVEAIAAELRCLFGECSAKFNMDGKVEELIIGLLRIVKAQRMDEEKAIDTSFESEMKKSRKGVWKEVKDQLDVVASKAWIFG